jgi:DNA processing protein
MLDNETTKWVECSLLFCGREKLLARLLEKHISVDEILKNFGKRADKRAVQKIISDCRENAIEIITQQDERFPRSFFAAGAPLLFYAKGDTTILMHTKSTGIIGARKAASYSLRVCGDITRQLVHSGAIIVSGFAKGIDQCAHTECIKSGGRTIAVLGCGIGTDYPKGSLDLQAAIAKSGVVISEYPPFSAPTSLNFPRRNRLIAALCDKLLVVEASGKSGCLNTVSHALQQGKEVYVLPPYDIKSESCQGQVSLIRDGATIAFDAQDIY